MFGPTFVVKVVGTDFMYAHWEEFIRLHPRTEALETPIDDPKNNHTRTMVWHHDYKTPKK